jgi:hypothetical protein
VRTVAGLPDSRLREEVSGKRYDFYRTLHGVAQHELHQAGSDCSERGKILGLRS